ncbi:MULTISPECIES: TlpA family protein disulfide reductase [Flavobacterium]|uniref:TlpA family protein disulfide reductase n=1 Tax=Flavobacterium jumunjinense TaxID=998845 RepID=A0ABV5GJP5_9FLAO|nr:MULTISPECIES: TlpA disulfide reductase family protein [Flavobacterium]
MKKVILLFLFAIVSTYAQDSSEMVSFEGKIANRNSDSIVVSSGRNFGKTIKLNKKGEFKDAFEIPAAGLFQIFDGTEATLVYLKSGYNLKLTMDAKKFDESIVYSGNGSKENNYLAKKALSDEAFGIVAEDLMKEDQAGFTRGLNKKKESDLANLSSADIDADLVALLNPMIEQDAKMFAQYYGQKLEASKMAGTSFPSFSFENHKGGMSKISDFKGKLVYIDVWATWCGPCRAEIPFLKKAEEKYKGKNIEFVSISIDSKKDYDKWKKFVIDKKLGGVQLIAENDWNSDLVKALKISGIPRFILVDVEGNIMIADAPRPSSEAFNSALDELLNYKG